MNEKEKLCFMKKAAKIEKENSTRGRKKLFLFPEENYTKCIKKIFVIYELRLMKGNKK